MILVHPVAGTSFHGEQVDDDPEPRVVGHGHGVGQRNSEDGLQQQSDGKGNERDARDPRGRVHEEAERQQYSADDIEGGQDVSPDHAKGLKAAEAASDGFRELRILIMGDADEDE